MGAIGIRSVVPPDTEPLIRLRCKQQGSLIAAVPSLSFAQYIYTQPYLYLS